MRENISKFLIKSQTRMHSSRMRTGRSLTVCCSLLPGGEVCLVWGVSAPGGVCLVPRGCLPGPGGPGGVCLVCGGVCLVRGGVCLVWGGLPGWGGLLPGGVSAWSGGVVCSGGLVSQHALRQTPSNLWTEWMTDRCKNITLATTSLWPVINMVTFHQPIRCWQKKIFTMK